MDKHGSIIFVNSPLLVILVVVKYQQETEARHLVADKATGKMRESTENRF